jgi:hypothetical protein
MRRKLSKKKYLIWKLNKIRNGTWVENYRSEIKKKTYQYIENGVTITRLPSIGSSLSLKTNKQKFG